MKKLILFLILLFSLSSVATATPTLIHTSTNPTTIGNTATAYTAKLPAPILNANAGIAAVENGTGASPSNCTDDKSNAWTSAVTDDDSNNRIAIYYRLNITDGARTLTCNYAAAKSDVKIHLTEWKDIDAIDNTCSAHYASGTTLDCSANMTFAQTGNLIVAFGTQNDTYATIAAWTPGSSFTMIAQDIFDSSFLEYRVYGSTTAFKPQFTTDASRHNSMVAAGFRAASQGTADSGMFPINMGHFRHKAADTAPVWNFACRGDETAIIVIWNGAAGRAITGIASANTTGTWTQAGTGSVSGGSGKNQHWYLPNGSCAANTTITPTMSGGSEPDGEVTIISWVGMHATPLDSVATAVTGNDVSGTAFSGSTSTPSGTSVVGGYIISYIGAATGSGSRVTGSPGYPTSPTTDPVIDTSPVGENQTAVLFPITAVAAYTVTWTPNSIAIGTYADYQTVWIPAVSTFVSGGGKKAMTMGIGNEQK